MANETNDELTIWSGQWYQIGIGAISIIIFAIAGPPQIPGNQYPKDIFSLSVSAWFWIAILVPILHQVIIGPLWRFELLEKGLSKFFGSTDSAFLFFKIVFVLFFIPRIFVVIPLSILTRQTIIPSFVATIAFILGLIITPVVIYGMYSVRFHFGINRAFGGDHFYDTYRSLPIVNEGIFKYTNNAMYTIVLAIVWLPALYLGSLSGLIVGLFNHLFVWVHYFATEKPDMEYIYG